jgi:hypothetical protein
MHNIAGGVHTHIRAHTHAHTNKLPSLRPQQGRPASPSMGKPPDFPGIVCCCHQAGFVGCPILAGHTAAFIFEEPKEWKSGGGRVAPISQYVELNVH